MMRTLLEAPPRGTLVKTLYGYPQEMGPLVDDLTDWDVSPTLREWNVPNVDRWLDALLDGCRNTLAPILLCYMPKVVEIRTIKGADESGLHGPSFLSPILCAAWRHPERLDLVHRFEHLTSLYMGYDSVHAELISGFFRLPALQRLILFGVDGCMKEFLEARQLSTPKIGSWEWKEESSGVESLEVSGALPSSVLDKMIKSCSSLKHFTSFGHTYLDIEPDWYHNVLKSLSTHVASLKCLSFDGCRHDDSLVLPSFTFQLQLGVLDQLDTYAGPLTLLLNPEQLEMPNQLVALADHLPSTIEHLLLEVNHSWDPHLLLDPSTSLPLACFPKLKRVYIRYLMGGEEDSDAVQDEDMRLDAG
jgi:hypothetical protein